jgi:hypothetical protein
MSEEIVDIAADEPATEVTSEVTAEETVTRRRRKSATTEVTSEVTAEEEPVEYMSAQTRAEMEMGAVALKKHIASNAAE